MHGAANCVSCAVNCHIEHIACLLSFDMDERELAFEITGLGLFCGDDGMAGMARAHMRLSPAAIRQWGIQREAQSWQSEIMQVGLL